MIGCHILANSYNHTRTILKLKDRLNQALSKDKAKDPKANHQSHKERVPLTCGENSILDPERAYFDSSVIKIAI